MTAPAGASASERVLVVNGDDFGRTPGINRGVIGAYERGILTSASLMVRWPAAGDAAAYCRARPGLGLGVHVDLAEWAFREGRWRAVYQVVATDDVDAVAAEVTAQVDTFRRLVGRDPTHLDSHQHVHLHEPVRTAVLDAARTLGVPVRSCTAGLRYCGDFYGQTGTGEPWPEGVTVANLRRIIATLGPGVTELGCHPGEGDDAESVYRSERSAEVAVLCHPGVRQALAERGVRLAAFAPGSQLRFRDGSDDGGANDG